MKEMKDCDLTCASLRDDIRRLRNYHMRIKATARCAFTNQDVLSSGEPFYVFPSGYVILSSALKTEVLPYLSDRQRARVKEIENLLLTNQGQVSKQTLELELDGIIAPECPLTGSIMVESIDRDFDDCDEIGS
jgi:vacuolar protein sorting-associated protein 18